MSLQKGKVQEEVSCRVYDVEEEDKLERLKEILKINGLKISIAKKEFLGFGVGTPFSPQAFHTFYRFSGLVLFIVKSDFIFIRLTFYHSSPPPIPLHLVLLLP